MFNYFHLLLYTIKLIIVFTCIMLAIGLSYKFYLMTGNYNERINITVNLHWYYIFIIHFETMIVGRVFINLALLLFKVDFPFRWSPN